MAYQAQCSFGETGIVDQQRVSRAHCSRGTLTGMANRYRGMDIDPRSKYAIAGAAIPQFMIFMGAIRDPIVGGILAAVGAGLGMGVYHLRQTIGTSSTAETTETGPEREFSAPRGVKIISFLLALLGLLAVIFGVQQPSVVFSDPLDALFLLIGLAALPASYGLWVGTTWGWALGIGIFAGFVFHQVVVFTTGNQSLLRVLFILVIGGLAFYLYKWQDVYRRPAEHHGTP